MEAGWTQVKVSFLLWKRGSLNHILYNERIPLDRVQQVRFAVDVAKGMRFLHSLSPPCVHRDLKPANLLVTDTWVVKVADFGSATTLEFNEDRHRRLRQRAASELRSLAFRNTAQSLMEESYGRNKMNMAEPLLTAFSSMSCDVGTLFWKAPEMLSGRSYGAPVDVFR